MGAVELCVLGVRQSSRQVRRMLRVRNGVSHARGSVTRIGEAGIHEVGP